MITLVEALNYRLGVQRGCGFHIQSNVAVTGTKIQIIDLAE